MELKMQANDQDAKNANEGYLQQIMTLRQETNRLHEIINKLKFDQETQTENLQVVDFQTQTQTQVLSTDKSS
tara:strand:- start:743 stop:958 length:216 start_codon:yes stop_codon:yes gene_type:complete